MLFLLASLIGCTEKPKPLVPYTLKIKRDALSATLSGFQEEIKVDTIYAVDDLSAYSEGITQYYSHLVTEKTSSYELFRTKSYSIQDTNGVDLEVKLPKNVVDSIKKSTKIISDKLANDLKN